MDQSGKRGFLASRAWLVFVAFAAIGGYFLWTEHRAHLALAIPYLPYLLLLACPLLHVFMHGGHGGHQSDTSQAPPPERQSSSHRH